IPIAWNIGTSHCREIFVHVEYVRPPMHDIIKTCTCRCESFLEAFHHGDELTPEIPGRHALVFQVRGSLSGNEDHLAPAFDRDHPGEVRVFEYARRIDALFFGCKGAAVRPAQRAGQRDTEGGCEISTAVAHGEVPLNNV